ncbi:MAG TPA: gliding motility-associated C-terminal domain-containing protein [Saprospiraceae bacterium]|nr:gliding motility-associated C-terminal domain-containing protein [Saprospiraceae bacterium]
MYVWSTCGVALAQQAPCMSHIDSLRILCYDNFTPLDSTDDFYHLCFWVVGGSGSDTDSFHISWNGNLDAGHFAYGTYHELELPSTGLQYTIYATDQQDASCIDSFITPALFACSAPCRFDTSVHVEIHCNNATTINNTSDDYYSVSFEIASISTKPGYYVYIDGDSMGVFPYNQLNYINRPADSLHHQIEFRDTREDVCFFTTLLGRFVPCSADCFIEEQYLTIECNNNGTLFDPADDQIHIVSVITDYKGSDSFSLYIDEALFGIYGYGDTMRLTLPYPSDTLSIKMEDQEKYDCVLHKAWSLPPACSIDCSQNPEVNVDLGADVVLNCLNAFTTLVAEKKPGFYSLWKNLKTGESSADDSIRLCTPGDYALVYTYSANGCPGAVDTLSISIDTALVLPQVEVKTIGTDLCVSAQYWLTQNAEVEYSYHWTYQAQNWYQDSIKIEGPAMVWAVAQNNRNGCSDSLLLNLKGPLGPGPVQLLPIDTLTCQQKEVYLELKSALEPGLEYQWAREEINPSWWSGTRFLVHQAGQYRLRVTNKTGGCSRDTVVSVTDLTETLTLSASDIPLLSCSQDSFAFTVKVTAQDGTVVKEENLTFLKGATNGTWLANEPGLYFKARGAGNYILTAIRKEDGCSATDTIEVEARAGQPLVWQSKDESCFDKNDGLLFLDGASEPILEWSLNGELQAGLRADGLAPGQYLVQSKDTLGCVFDTVVSIGAAVELKIQIGADVQLQYGETAQLRAEVNRSLTELFSYGWLPEEKVSCTSCMEVWIEGIEDGLFIFKAVDQNGCEAEASIRVQIERNVIITAPNIIAQEISGNNQFTIYGNEQVKKVNEIKVFDRWGNAIWQTTTNCLNQPSLGWDGTINGTQIETGVYTFVAEVEIFSGEKKLVSGDITWVK